MAIGPMVAATLTVVSLAASFPSPLYADSSAPPQPAAHRVAQNPFNTAQAQIARLRQTASQLRLLADQPIPNNLPPAARAELTRHEKWLHEAEQQISVLASQWEDQLKPLNTRNALEPVVDLNAFFAAQSETLQARLQRESLSQRAESEHVRASGATARLVIGNMH